MGKRWQEKINGRWRTVKACDGCGATIHTASICCVDCASESHVATRILDLGELQPGRVVQHNPFPPSRDPEFTARHFLLLVGGCAAVAVLAYAWALHCGWAP